MDFGVLRLAAGGGAEIGLAARDFRGNMLSAGKARDYI